jgi:hypothetical protein
MKYFKIKNTVFFTSLPVRQTGQTDRSGPLSQTGQTDWSDQTDRPDRLTDTQRSRNTDFLGAMNA